MSDWKEIAEYIAEKYFKDYDICVGEDCNAEINITDELTASNYPPFCFYFILKRDYNIDPDFIYTGTTLDELVREIEQPDLDTISIDYEKMKEDINYIYCGGFYYWCEELGYDN